MPASNIAKGAFALAEANTVQLSQITQNGLIPAIVCANTDGSNLEEADYDALPASKNTDNKLYVVFPNSQEDKICIEMG